MKCPNCQRDIFATSVICPYCRTQVQERISEKVMVSSNGEETNIQPELLNEKQKKVKKTKKMFHPSKYEITLIAIIIIGIGIIVGLLFGKKNNYDNNNKTLTTTTTEPLIKHTDNKGMLSSITEPTTFGTLTLASIYNPEDKKYYDVDLYGVRFIDNVEATTLASELNYTSKQNEFWYGLVYQVTFNDLKALKKGISPVLKPGFYLSDGKPFITINKQNYYIDFKTIYNNKEIKNNEQATITVLYQIPEFHEKYSICFGEEYHTLGCFSR